MDNNFSCFCNNQFNTRIKEHSKKRRGDDIVFSPHESLKSTYSADMFCLNRDADAMRLKQQKAAEKKAAAEGQKK